MICNEDKFRWKRPLNGLQCWINVHVGGREEKKVLWKSGKVLAQMGKFITILKKYTEGNSNHNPKIKTIQYCGSVVKCERKMQLHRQGQRNCWALSSPGFSSRWLLAVSGSMGGLKCGLPSFLSCRIHQGCLDRDCFLLCVSEVSALDSAGGLHICSCSELCSLTSFLAWLFYPR